MNNKFKLDFKRILIFIGFISLTSFISIQVYMFYISEPKIKIINKFWSSYTKIHESALNATLETYCNDGATLMIQQHIHEETNNLIKELNQ
jgi:hypothetical protein